MAGQNLNLIVNFPDKTIYVVASLVSEVGEKKLMIARITDDEEYEKNRNSFLTAVMGKCRLQRCEIEDIQFIRSKEELDAYKQNINNQRSKNGHDD